MGICVCLVARYNAAMKRCWQCGTPWTERHTPGARDECERCLASLHVCRNCRFFDEEHNPWCREPAARDERPREPGIPCTCSFFVFRDEAEQEPDRSREARQKLASIFGEAPPDEAGEQEPPQWLRTDRPAFDPEQVFKPPDESSPS